MSRRLRQLSEESIETGGKAAQKTLQEANFDPDLKTALEERIRAGQSGQVMNPQAAALANLPRHAGRGTRDIAGAQPWQGHEAVEDTALRMLTDAHKPLKVPRSTGSSVRLPRKVDTGHSKGSGGGSGNRLANARDKTSMYSFMKDPGLSSEERDKLRQEMKARFQPGARAVPATIHGLASLAHERIEDAIARGQFKNLPRGKKIERDHNASSPFIDTTEYLMNKIIQKQDIVPPWIEKQQELVSTATKFRSRLRNDWKRHVARVISSWGGSLDLQMQRAADYAAAEARENPPKRKEEKVNTVDTSGHLSQITVTGDMTLPSSPAQPAVQHVTITATALDDPSSAKISQQTTDAVQAAATDIWPEKAAVRPFRDSKWEATELAYHKLAIEDLNTLTRSYNLMAPNIAKKPYFSLQRELRSCFSDVAPVVAAAIRERATTAKPLIEGGSYRRGGVLAEMVSGRAARVHDDKRPLYGWREFWRDLWNSEKTAP